MTDEVGCKYSPFELHPLVKVGSYLMTINSQSVELLLRANCLVVEMARWWCGINT
jgi:hypothetical protein